MERIRTLLLFIMFILADCAVWAQPYDLFFPTDESPDSLTKEVRDLHDIERDLAIEKLTREPNKVDAYIELAKYLDSKE